MTDQESTLDTSSLAKYMEIVAEGTLLLFACAVFSYAFSFVKRVIIIRSLSPEQYGLFTIAMSVSAVVTIVSSLGLNTGTQRFIALYRGRGDLERVKGSIVSATHMLLASVLVAMALLMVFAKPIESLLDKQGLAWVLFVLAFLIPLQQIIDFITSVYQGFEIPTVKALFADIFLSLLVMSFVLTAAIFRKTLGGMMSAIILGNAFTVVAMLVYIKYRIPESIKGVKPLTEARKLLLFSIPLAISISVSIISTHVDTAMLSYYEPSVQVGLYSSAIVLYQVLPMIAGVAVFMYAPVATRMIGEKKEKELRSLFPIVTKWIVVILLPLAFIYFGFSSQILTFLFGSTYDASAFVLLILSVGGLVLVILGPTGATLVAFGRTKLLMLDATIAGICNVVLNRVLIPGMGINGAAIATSISTVILALLIFGQTLYYYRIHPFSNNYVKTLLSSMLIVLLLYYPLRAGLEFTRLLIPLYYILILSGCIAAVFLTNSIDDVDRVLYRVARQKVVEFVQARRKTR
ncbi:MAG: flippase [Actinomycetia bacterium]|nr:flippase [Actinomycetes bacterium]